MRSTLLRPAAAWVLAAAVPLHAVEPPPDHQLPKSPSQRFSIRYRANPSALPLTRVELWYTRDLGATWHNYGLDDDGQSPAQFDAAEEGLYGFYFVLANALGRSGEPPSPGSEPQAWCFVDYTPPIVQLHPVQADAHDGRRLTLRIRWTAIDAHFDPRPIELDYHLVPDGEWSRIADRLANTGRYDWLAPAELPGRVVIRLTARDRGGHRVSAVSRAVEPAAPQSDNTMSPSGSQPAAEGFPADSGIGPGDQKRAEALFRRGMSHKEQGEHRLAAARFQDALAINPRMPLALVNLAETLYVRREYQAAVEAFELAVRFEPDWTEARRGLVRPLMVLGRYDDASAQLAHILEDAPGDAEAWLTLGDVAMARGDQLMAREHWHKAATVEPSAGEIIGRANGRLENLRRMAGLIGPQGK